MIQSMTAFGYYTKSLKDILLEIEIRSLNSKFFDFNYKGPSYLYVHEKETRNIIKKKLSRGKIDLIIKINYNNSPQIKTLKTLIPTVQWFSTLVIISLSLP